jgi:hypothetical protein
VSLILAQITTLRLCLCLQECFCVYVYKNVFVNKIMLSLIFLFERCLYLSTMLVVLHFIVSSKPDVETACFCIVVHILGYHHQILFQL